MISYQSLIRSINPTVNPAGVEASMRLQYSTLDHLGRDDFQREIDMALECEREQPGFLRMVANSFGMSREFDEWEAA